MSELSAYLERRNALLRSLDMKEARLMMPATTDAVRLIALHKARFECTAIEDALRLESRDWLATRGLHSMVGDPILADTELPK